MTKDRLKDLMRARQPDAGQQAIVDKDEEAAIGGDENFASSPQLDDVADGAGFMEDFFAEVDAIRRLIDDIEASVEEVRRRHSDILASPNQDEKTKEELESLMVDIKVKAGRARTKLKAIEAGVERDEADSSASSADVRIRRTQHLSLSRQLVLAMSRYNTCQVEYRAGCKRKIARHLELTGRETTNKELEDMIESGNPAIFTQGILTDSQQARQSLADIEARHRDIIKLECSIKELHDMFQDMALLVENQGEMVDRIEFNVQQAADYVEAAKKDTKKAVRYQSKARKKKIFLLVCLAVLLVCVIGGILGGVLPKA